MKRLEDLPADAQQAILSLPPAMRESAVRLYPDAETDRLKRAEKERREKARARSEAIARVTLAKRAIAGEFGREVEAAAVEIFSQAEGKLMAPAVDRIVSVVRVAQRKAQARR